jgi:hypothetical protein
MRTPSHGRASGVVSGCELGVEVQRPRMRQAVVIRAFYKQQNSARAVTASEGSSPTPP